MMEEPLFGGIGTGLLISRTCSRTILRHRDTLAVLDDTMSITDWARHRFPGFPFLFLFEGNHGLSFAVDVLDGTGSGDRT